MNVLDQNILSIFLQIVFGSHQNQNSRVSELGGYNFGVYSATKGHGPPVRSHYRFQKTPFFSYFHFKMLFFYSH